MLPDKEKIELEKIELTTADTDTKVKSLSEHKPKLKERWAKRKGQKLIAEGVRPDLIARRERERKQREINKRNTLLLVEQGKLVPKREPDPNPTDKDSTPVPDVELRDIARDIINSPDFKARVANSPGLLQLVLNKLMTETGSLQLTVEVVSYAGASASIPLRNQKT